MSAKLDQPYPAILPRICLDHSADVPPPVDYRGSNCADYDRYVSALFFAPRPPGQPAMEGTETALKKLGLIRRIQPNWADTTWDVSLRMKGR